MTILSSTDAARVRVLVTGLVQGVGFRPFVYQLAAAGGLSGFVGNDAAGVFIEVEGSAAEIDLFLTRLVDDAPPLAQVHSVVATMAAPVGDSHFRIVESEHGVAGTTYVAPDIAVCGDCLRELFEPADRRYRYPFITCTNCGPRFTITTALPYDRATTTMAGFALCRACNDQYRDPGDRRFHAQPLACAACGPRLWLEDATGTIVEGDDAIEATQELLASGGVVAIKGLGGYHLACDATSESAVTTLRARKGRPHKPFAVMAANLAVAGVVSDISAEEAALLVSPARPIVLTRRNACAFPVVHGVAPGSPHLGIFLPYTPLHHLLFAAVPGRTARAPQLLVMTSGNLTDEPICFQDDDARARLAGIADAFLMHDRPIHVPCDDSVLRVIDGVVTPIRRSRGYAPLPIRLPVDAPPMLAVGGELKNTFCVANGRDAWLGQHIGDMGSVETLTAFERGTAHLRALYDVDPTVIAADLHPGYHTTRWAERTGQPVSGVQHHHAHLAALLAEHDEPLDTRIVGVVFDGTGYGTDATIWGGEILFGGYAAVERVAHLAPVPLPGGDSAIRRPYRSALAYLWRAGITWTPDLPPVAAAAPGELEALARQLERRFQCVETTSMGRLFDAVAALVGLHPVVTFEAQAAIELEAQAQRCSGAGQPYRFHLEGGMLDPTSVLAAIVDDVRRGEDLPAIAAGFHHAVAEAVSSIVSRVSSDHGVSTVGLTGGVFQNEVLVTALRSRLEGRGLRLLTHRLVPPNDGGIALGQAVVAAVRHHSIHLGEED